MRCSVRFSRMKIGLHETLTGALLSKVTGNAGRIRVPRGFYSPGFWTAFACRALQQHVPADVIDFEGSDNESYSKAMRLQEILGGTDDYDHIRLRDGQTYSSLEHLNCAEATDGATSRIKKCIRGLFDGTGAEQFVDGVGNIVAELHDNVWSHGRASGVSMAQRWEQTSEFEFALADHGLGFLRELRRVGLGAGLDDSGAIRWCIQQGNTTSPGANEWAQKLPGDAIGNPFQGIENTTDSDVHHAGLGLWKFVELVRLFRGTAWIASGSACLLISPGREAILPIRPWGGVAMSCRFNEAGIKAAPTQAEDPAVLAILQILREPAR